MSQHYLDENILEGGTLKLTLAWFDDTGSAVTPTSASYTLREAKTGAIVNSRSDVAISSLSTTNDVVLSGDDLTPGRKKLYVDAAYNSAAGTGLPLRSVVEFVVRPFE
jgi:hypothetical protein